MTTKGEESIREHYTDMQSLLRSLQLSQNSTMKGTLEMKQRAQDTNEELKCFKTYYCIR